MFPLMCDYYEVSNWKAERDKIGLPQIKGFCASVNILLNTCVTQTIQGTMPGMPSLTCKIDNL